MNPTQDQEALSQYRATSQEQWTSEEDVTDMTQEDLASLSILELAGQGASRRRERNSHPLLNPSTQALFRKLADII